MMNLLSITNYRCKQKNMYNLILSEVIKELEEKIKKDPSLSSIQHCLDEVELHSVLRDRIFHSDFKTKEFIDKIRMKFAVEGKSEPQECSEGEFIELLYQCLEKSSKIKNSKFKITNFYFSNEKDLIIKINLENKKETQFRILTVKTS